MEKQFDENKVSTFYMQILRYLDANNLCGWAVCKYLPSGEFKWINPNAVDITNISKDSPKGYILGVDLKYPKELHDKHSEFPLAPEN